MGESRNLYPHTRQEDTEVIKRSQRDFSVGMQTDVSPVDIADNAVVNLTNMRGTTHGLRGRHGSALFDGVGNAVRLPHLFTDLTLSLAGTTITCTNDTPFEDDMVGYKIGTSDNRAFFISEFLTSSTVSVTGKDMTEFTGETTCRLRGPINARFCDDETGVEYFLIGKKVYVREELHGEFSEPYFIHSESELYSSSSTFFKVGAYVCLSNANGLIVLNIPQDSLYGWQANGSLPAKKLNRSDEGTERKVSMSAYSAAYTYIRLKGQYINNRLTNEVFIECETPPYAVNKVDVDIPSLNPPYFPDGNVKDTTLLKFNGPIEDSMGKVLKILDSQYRQINAWKKLYEDEEKPYIKLSYNGVYYVIYFSFDNIYSMKDVEESIQIGLSDGLSEDIRVKRFIDENDELTFMYYSRDNKDIIVLDPVGQSGAGLNLLETILEDSGDTHHLAKPVKYFVYPEGRTDISNYGYYRTADIYPHTTDRIDITDSRTINSPEVLGWIDDIPVCKICKFNVNTSLGTASALENSFNDNDLGNALYYSGGTLNVKKYASNSSVYEITSGGTTTTELVCYFGASDMLSCKQWNGSSEESGTVVDIVTGTYLFSDSDIGKMLFWDDGHYSIVVAVVSDTRVTVLDSSYTDESYLLINPTNRVYTDNTNDYKLAGYTSSFPLNTRFFNKVPNTNIAAHYNGVLVTAEKGASDIVFSDSARLYQVGYHNSLAQINTSLDKGIKSMAVVNGYFVVCSDDTHIIDIAQAFTSGNPNYGEAYTVLPDPVLIAKGIGVAHQAGWGEGFTEGSVVVTNEPAIRIFNGTRYGADLSKGLIQRTKLKKLGDLILLGVDKNRGIFLWGETGE